MATGKLTLFPLTMVVTGNMMGAGIFLLPSSLAGLGSISLLGWLITVIGAFLLSLIFVRLGSVCKQGVGIHAFISEGLGLKTGLVVVYGYWISIWIGNIAVAISGVSYFSNFQPALSDPWLASLAALAVIWFLSLLNMWEIRRIGQFQVITTCCMLIPVIMTCFIGWGSFQVDYLLSSVNVTGKPDTSVLSESVTLTLWSFIGLESACNLSSHARNPSRDVPYATLLGTLIAGACYLLSTTTIMGVIPNHVLQYSAAPFSDAITSLLGQWGGTLVGILAVIACLGSLNGWVLMHSQVACIAARKGIMPAFFAVQNRFSAPWIGLLVTAVLMSFMILLSVEPTVQEHYKAVTLMAVNIMLVIYFLAGISCWRLLRKSHHGLNPAWGGVIVCALVYCCWGLLSSESGIQGYLHTLLLNVPDNEWP